MRSRVLIVNEFMVVDFIEAVIGEGCRWREGLGVTSKVVRIRW